MRGGVRRERWLPDRRVARLHYSAGPRRRPEDAIYTLPVMVIAFVFILIFAILTELPLWMIGLALALALVGYLLERKRPPQGGQRM